MLVLVGDASLARDVATCMRRAVAGRWHGLTSLEESRYLLSGRAVHAGLATYLRAAGYGDVAEAMDVIEAMYGWFGSDPARVEPDDRLSWANVKRVVQAWFEKHPVPVLPFETRAVEEPFALPIANGVVYVGRIDGDVVDKATRTPYVLEHKTTGRVDKAWFRQFDNDAQNSLYLWAKEQISGDLYTGIFLNAIELSWAPTSDMKCKTHGVKYSECGALHPNHAMRPVARTPDEVESAKRDFVALMNRFWDVIEQYPELEDLPNVPAEGRFHGACSFCTFREWCAVGAKPEAIPGHLREEVFEPFAGVQPGRFQELNDVVNAVAGSGMAKSG